MFFETLGGHVEAASYLIVLHVICKVSKLFQLHCFFLVAMPCYAFFAQGRVQTVRAKTVQLLVSSFAGQALQSRAGPGAVGAVGAGRGDEGGQVRQVHGRKS